jgi:Zn-dependent protease
MLKLKIHPSFAVLAVIMCLLGHALAFFSVLISALLHELAHAVAARNQGYTVSGITLMPYGAVLGSESLLDKNSEVIIAAAGPIASLALSLLTVAFWWLVPDSFYYTKPFYLASLTVGLFNLIPVFPLDGARIILGFSKNRMKALSVLKRTGICFSLILFICFIASAFFEINISFGILAIFLFIGATSGTKTEMYMHVLNSSPLVKNYSEGVKIERLLISADVPLRRIIKKVNSKTIKHFDIVDECGKITASVSEEDLLKLAACNKQFSTVKNAIANHSRG